jgi:ATP-dependent helicase Lhr and Lhr-like helicase
MTEARYPSSIDAVPTITPALSTGLARVEAYFAHRGWSPFAFQREAWNAYLASRSGLVHAPTGSGKTWSVFGGPAAEAIDRMGGIATDAPFDTRVIEQLAKVRKPRVGRGVPKKLDPRPAPSVFESRLFGRANSDPLALLWLTPMRALANDTAHNLAVFSRALGLNWSVELRTSDTTQTVRKRQRERLPSVLVTTPESLSVLLSFEDAHNKLASLRCVVVDEWHELLSSKRGTQAELGLARLRWWNPGLRTWGLSATLGNLEEAARVLIPSSGTGILACDSSGNGLGLRPAQAGIPVPLKSTSPLLIHSNLKKELQVRTLYPEKLERFPWAGHIGGHMTEFVANAIEEAGSTLVFCNTRAQAEIWFRALMTVRHELIGAIAIHHGSLDRKLRTAVEQLLRDGKIKAVVCTSSLDLGVDFAAVDQVIQVGSPKGIARLMQRAGRSGHRPGEPSKLLCVPTNAFEFVEFSAAREGIEQKAVESRRPIIKPLDVLVQHVVTIAAGGGFDADELYEEVRTTAAFADLTLEEWGWVMDFVTRGGPTLTAYDRFRKVVLDPNTSLWAIANDRLAKLHRLGIGTITGDGTITIVSTSGKKLGTVEEGFIGRMNPGDVFTFAGQALELISIRQMVAKVRPNKKKRAQIVSWPGSKFPLSTMLSQKVRERIEQAGRGEFVDDEMRAVKPILDVQAQWSRLPTMEELLIERTLSREGVHYYLYPFLGRLVHEGLAAVVGHRIGRETSLPVTATFTDYGIELLMPRSEQPKTKRDIATHTIKVASRLSPDEMPDVIFERRAGEELDEAFWRRMLSPENLLEDLLLCLNAGELTRRQFRDISRVAGLLVPATPNAPRSTRQLQASSELFYDVFMEFDPNNLLLQQAKREVLEQQLEIKRLTESLEHLKVQKLVLIDVEKFSPMAFPLWAQRISSQTLRMQSAGERIERMLEELEKAAD